MISTSAATVLFTALTFVSGVLIARCLGESGRGQYGAAYFWAQFLAGFGSLSFFEAAIVRARTSERPESYLSGMLAAGGLLTLLTCGAFATALDSGLIKVPGVSRPVMLSFVCVTIAMTITARSLWAVENIRRNFRMLNVERVFTPILFTASAVAVYVLWPGDLNAVLAVFVASAVPFLVWRLFRYRRSLFGAMNFAFLRESVVVGSRFHIATALAMITTQLDRLIVVTQWPPDRIGHYLVGMSVAGAAIAVVSQALAQILLPTLTGLDPARRRDRLERFLRYSILATTGLAGAIYVTAPVLIPLVYGAGFASSVMFAQGLALAMAPLPLRTIALEANRSMQRGRPGVEMAVASLLAFLGVYAATGLHQPRDLLLAIGLSNLAALVAGLRRPVLAGELRLGAALVPRVRDVAYLTSQLLAYGREMASSPMRRVGR